MSLSSSIETSSPITPGRLIVHPTNDVPNKMVFPHSGEFPSPIYIVQSPCPSLFVVGGGGGTRYGLVNGISLISVEQSLKWHHLSSVRFGEDLPWRSSSPEPSKWSQSEIMIAISHTMSWSLCIAHLGNERTPPFLTALRIPIDLLQLQKHFSIPHYPQQPTEPLPITVSSASLVVLAAPGTDPTLLVYFVSALQSDPLDSTLRQAGGDNRQHMQNTPLPAAAFSLAETSQSDVACSDTIRARPCIVGLEIIPTGGPRRVKRVAMVATLTNGTLWIIEAKFGVIRERILLTSSRLLLAQKLNQDLFPSFLVQNSTISHLLSDDCAVLNHYTFIRSQGTTTVLSTSYNSAQLPLDVTTSDREYLSPQHFTRSVAADVPFCLFHKDHKDLVTALSPFNIAHLPMLLLGTSNGSIMLYQSVLDQHPSLCELGSSTGVHLNPISAIAVSIHQEAEALYNVMVCAGDIAQRISMSSFHLKINEDRILVVEQKPKVPIDPRAQRLFIHETLFKRWVQSKMLILLFVLGLLIPILNYFNQRYYH